MQCMKIKSLQEDKLMLIWKIHHFFSIPFFLNIGKDNNYISKSGFSCFWSWCQNLTLVSVSQAENEGVVIEALKRQGIGF